MNCTFYRPERINIEEFENIVGKLRYDLHRLETERHDEWRVYTYVYSLCKKAKTLNSNSDMCFWGLAAPNEMPSDARVEYFYIPTYVATAFMVRATLMYPSLMNEATFLDSDLDFSVEMVKRTLAKAMLGCTGRNFDGSDVLKLKDCIKIFEDAGMDSFIEKYSDLCPHFNNMYLQAKEYLNSKKD